jgi:Zn finger protein HypA/HybF involved in hydrogenase expression
MVWFCLACDDQAPWTADEVKPCPTCGSVEQVKAATRLRTMEDVAEDRDRRPGV